jgi:hypothetical protein
MRNHGYIPLSRARRLRLRKRTSLWLGEDHFLHLVERSYSEEYRRFYFKDVQSIIVCETSGRMITNVVFSILIAGTFLLFRMVASVNVSAAIALVAFGLPVIINTLRGTACKVYLKTRVQREELSSLDRIRRAENVMRRIRPLLHAAQGKLSAEDLTERVRELQSSTPAHAAGEPTSTMRRPIDVSDLEQSTAPATHQETE